MTRTRHTVVLAALFLTGALAFGPALAQSGMMGGGHQGQPISWSEAQQAIQDSAPSATENQADNSLTFTGDRIHITVIAVQPGKPDTTFEIGGLIDPTLHIPRGAFVTLTLVNMDYGQDMAHGLILTRQAPPYPSKGSELLGSGIPPLAARTKEDPQSATYYAASIRFAASHAGTYYYLCQVPGHAQHGMYGKLIVD